MAALNEEGFLESPELLSGSFMRIVNDPEKTGNFHLSKDVHNIDPRKKIEVVNNIILFLRFKVFTKSRIFKSSLL